MTKPDTLGKCKDTSVFDMLQDFLDFSVTKCPPEGTAGCTHTATPVIKKKISYLGPSHNHLINARKEVFVAGNARSL